MSMALDRRIEKEDINSYIVKKREMFLVQYSLGVKRDEISKLEEIAKVIYHHNIYGKFVSIEYRQKSINW